MSRKIPKGYRNETSLPKRSGVFLGLVRKNLDGQRMGRLMVWVSDFGPDSEEYWIAVSYASPFAGATRVSDNKEGGETEDDSQKAYGWWATPPDIDNQVLCCFLDGDVANGYWFACIYPQNMNHMVPGIGSATSTDETMNQKFPVYGPPTVEYNKKSDEVGTLSSSLENRESVKRPVFTPLANGLIEQGLTNDPERGISNSSARRDSPPRVYGLLSPRGNSIHIDDGPAVKDKENEFIRLRTRSGVQVLLHETSGYIYMITKDGKSWVEISDGGIDMYSAGPISMSSDADVNIHAGGKIGLHGNQGIHMAAETISAYTSADINIASGGNFNMYSESDTNFYAALNFNVSTAEDLSLSAGKDLKSGACGVNSRNGRAILDNSGGPIPNDVMFPTVLQQVLSRLPTHEPFGHLISANTADQTGVDANGKPTTEVIGSDGSVSQVPTPVNADKAAIMKFLYDKFRSLGFTVEGARTMVAQIGRENDYRAGPMFGTHTDVSNGKKNVGVISWQGDRRNALLSFLKQKGCVDAKGGIKPGYATLGAQCEFVKHEMQGSYRKSLAAVTTPGKTYAANIEDVISRNYVGWAKGGGRNFSASDSARALSKMNNYYNVIKAATKADG
jgi:hypothetical protein